MNVNMNMNNSDNNNTKLAYLQILIHIESNVHVGIRFLITRAVRHRV